jgi:hypothetical protein
VNGTRYIAMPFYYFDTRNDVRITEDEGFELPGIEEAKAEAIGYLAEAAAQFLGDGQHPLVCTIKDENKRPLLRLKLALEITGDKS